MRKTLNRFPVLMWLVIVALGFESLACYRDYDSERTVKIGPSKKVSLAIYFKKGTTNDEVNAFKDNVVRIDTYNLALRFHLNKDGYEGVAVTFSTETTPEQREQLKRSVRESPLVHKVYEDVVPSEIKDL